MNRSMLSRLFFPDTSAKARAKRTKAIPLTSVIISLEPRVMLSAAPITGLQGPLAPVTQDLNAIMTDLTATNTGALSSIINVVNAAETSVSTSNPAGNVAAAKTGLNAELTVLVGQLRTLESEIANAGAHLPATVNPSLRSSSSEISGAIRGFAGSLEGVIDMLTLAQCQIPGLTVSTLTGGEIAGISGAAAPHAVNALGQQLDNLLGSLAENTSTFLSDLNVLDGASMPVATITGTVTNSNGGAAIPNITVELVDATGVVVATTVSGINGNYSLPVNENGGYAVREVTPAGYTQITPSFSTAAPAAQPGTPGAGQWGYFGSTILPADWDADAPFGGDPDQSPVNITGPTVNLQTSNLLSELGQFASHTTVAANTTTVTNTGFQLKVGIPQNNQADPAPTIVLNGTTYTLQQFHFHDTSENTVNGQSYPMEQHMVFTSASGAELVLATFIQVGVANSSFQTILDAAANLGTAANSTQPITSAINFQNLLPSQTQGWFYQGSLTTPPLSAPVNWMVLSQPITISAAQLQQYEITAGDLGFLPNARPVQPLDGRELNEIDNYVNVQAGQDLTVTGQPISSVNFTLAGSARIPTPHGSTTATSANPVLDTVAVAIASSLNNLESSIDALEGILSTISENDLSRCLASQLRVDLANIHSLIRWNKSILKTDVEEANSTSRDNVESLVRANLDSLALYHGHKAGDLGRLFMSHRK